MNKKNIFFCLIPRFISWLRPAKPSRGGSEHERTLCYPERASAGRSRCRGRVFRGYRAKNAGKSRGREELARALRGKKLPVRKARQDLKAHTAALVRKYTKSAEENMKQAALHRKMAREQRSAISTRACGTQAKGMRMGRTPGSGNDRLKA